MAQFVHIFDSRNQARLKRGGIRMHRRASGVYAMPVLADHLKTHQWMRELKRFTSAPMMAAQFRVPDSELLRIGRFNEDHLKTTASEAIGIAMAHSAPFGLEVIIPRPILPREILRFYVPPKVVGWRYYPESHGKRPCPCFYCQRGEPYSQRIERRDESA